VQMLAGLPILLFARVSAASSVMQAYVTPTLVTLCVIASLACVFFLVNGGIQYTTSSGNPEKLEHAKKIIKNALIGLVLVIAAATLTAILSHAYAGSSGTMADKLPQLEQITQTKTSTSLTDVLLKAITGLLQKVAESIGKPFLDALRYFTGSTPLMGDNSSVFNLWLAVVGITDVLFVLVVALLGFHVMSFSTFGFEELELKHLLPQLALVFMLINTSIFAIDGIIGLSNAMIHAVRAGFPGSSIWDPLIQIILKGPVLGIGGLLIMTALLVLSVMLLVYYVSRLVTLYLGAVLSPLILLLWLIPAFKDFAITTLKVYLTTIFVLFVHVVILLLASSLFAGITSGDGQPNAIMGLIIGIATIVALLKTQNVMQELSYAASAPRAAREVGGQFIRGLSSFQKGTKRTVKGVEQGAKGAKKVANKIRGVTPNSGSSRNKSSNNTTRELKERKQSSAQKQSGLQTGQTKRADKPKPLEKE
jgi:hypothetical protein